MKRILLASLLFIAACSKEKQDIDYSTIDSKPFTTTSGKTGTWAFVVQTNFGTATGNKYVEIDYKGSAHPTTEFSFTSPAGAFSVEIPGGVNKRLFFIQAAITGTPTLTTIIEK